MDQTAVATLLAHSGVAVAAIGFALLMGIRLPLSISRRLRKLQDAVSRIERGDLTSRVEVGPRDEIGNLTQGLNAMLDQIQENILQKEKEGEELKSRAEEITRTSSELETFNMLAVGREQRIVELKRKINELSKQMGKSSPYDLSFIEGSRQRDLETEESDS